MKQNNNVQQISELFSKLKVVRDATKLISQDSSFSIRFLHGSSKALFLHSLLAATNKRFILLAKNSETINDYAYDLQILNDNKDNFDNNIFNLISTHKHFNLQVYNSSFIAEIVDSISRFSTAKSALAMALPDTFDIKIPNKNSVKKHFLTLKKGQTLSLQQFATQLALNGFQKEQFVSMNGEYAVRGGIIDVFAPNMSNPFRIELWGEQIDSIRYFDSLSQRSKQEIDEIEFIDSMFIEQSEGNANIFEFIPNDTIFIIDSPDSIDVSANYLQSISKYQYIKINPISNTTLTLNSTPQPAMNSNIQRFVSELHKNQKLGINTFVAADSEVQTERLKNLVESIISNEFEPQSTINTRFTEDINLIKNDLDINAINWKYKSLSSGFYILDYGIAYFVENEIFARVKNTRSNKIKQAKGITLRELKELHIGDLVVHDDKGIGKFDGFQQIEIAGNKQDCLRMLFEGDDILYVHLNYLHKVQKYSATEGVVPRLSKLGSTEWLRKKERTKRKIKDIARDLILLYATRKMQTGFAFPSDTMWQKEFEASFIYEDTTDQTRTTIDVKKDMESEHPMDRLVCGDVGFGKTEIAIRAAFKATNAGKQTAVLVPTTILAQQHYFSFLERIAKYPINIDVISRFRTLKEQKEILTRLKEKKIDIIIGTHRLLSKDIKFNDLGLLIVDEEHRFGVSAKEKLRQIKANVDTLTLTATPIPRTLNFSLMGARDLSQIETPPRNRLPIETEVNTWDSDIVAKTILNELKRNGQVFLVNDKIQGLEKIEDELRMLLPSVRFATIHGQMPPIQVEDVMKDFIDKKYDVLLSTKIIESGIDIPNANTIIINNAQNFGLAELYQLRGRVGRSSIQAYCYLLVPSFATLTSKSLKRLLAIEEFTDLGSGLQLALRDLEIRGAGDLLGAEQSGFITEIGFELYQKVLEEAVTELKRDEFSDIFEKNKSEMPKLDNEEIKIEIDTDAFFPPEYISEDTERFYYYKLLYNAKTNAELTEIKNELSDRFGKIPNEVQELLFAIRLRIAALDTGFTRIQLKPFSLTLEFPNKENTEFYEKVFPIILDTLQLYDDVNLIQEKDTLILKKLFNEHNRNISRSIALDLLWNIKKNIEANF